MLPTVTTQVKNIQIIWSIQKNAVSLHRLTAKRFDSLAQLVEHNTFNVGVLGSNPKRITERKAKRRQQKDKSYKINILWDFFYCPLATLTAKKRALTDKN